MPGLHGPVVTSPAPRADSEPAYALLTATQRPYEDMHNERVRAHVKHAPQGGSMEVREWTDWFWLPVLVEEVGEVARAMCDRELSSRVREELVQVGAMVAAWIDSIDRDWEPVPAATETEGKP